KPDVLRTSRESYHRKSQAWWKPLIFIALSACSLYVPLPIRVAKWPAIVRIISGGVLTMSKFRIKMRLQGFELEVEGAREDASRSSRNLGEQVSALLQPAGLIIDGEAPALPPARAQNAEGLPAKKMRRRRQSNATGTVGDSSAIDFKHSPEKYGNPKQEWK